jgi:uncharacterized protein (TIGR02145 family)
MKIFASIMVFIVLSLFSCAEDNELEYPCSFCIKPSSSSRGSGGNPPPISNNNIEGTCVYEGIVYGDPVSYGDETYETVVIGEQTWLSRNLNYDPGTGNSYCYRNDPENCDKYGRLYDWSTAMGLDSSCNEKYCASDIAIPHRGICPEGWHLPSDVEWHALMNCIGSPTATKLKAASGWNYGDGTDDYGFSALPGGLYIERKCGFCDRGRIGYWWIVADETSTTGARLIYMNDEENIIEYAYGKETAYSIRCVKD